MWQSVVQSKAEDKGVEKLFEASKVDFFVNLEKKLPGEKKERAWIQKISLNSRSFSSFYLNRVAIVVEQPVKIKVPFGA